MSAFALKTALMDKKYGLRLHTNVFFVFYITIFYITAKKLLTIVFDAKTLFFNLMNFSKVTCVQFGNKRGFVCDIVTHPKR